MAAPVLTQAATIMCPHGGRAVPISQNPVMSIMGSPVLVITDVFPIVGCVFNISGAAAPCLNVQWTAPAMSLMVNNIPALLATSIGLCVGGSGAVPAIVTPGQVQVNAS